MWICRLLQSRRERRERIERDAGALLTFLGDMAYPEARNRARACRGMGDRAGDRFWSRVAVSIAKRTGREIGVKAADRYEREIPAQPAPEIQRAVPALNRALASIARGQHFETELHNLRAHVFQVLALVPDSRKTLIAADELVLAATALASAREGVRSCLDRSQYPPELEAAGAALERFRTALPCWSRGPRCSQPTASILCCPSSSRSNGRSRRQVPAVWRRSRLGREADCSLCRRRF